MSRSIHSTYKDLKGETKSDLDEMFNDSDSPLSDLAKKRAIKKKVKKERNLNKKNNDGTTHGILHAGFIGFLAFVARKKSRCKLIGNRLVILHDTIP